MSIKRMRVFAGPNGSGKTTIVKSLKNKINYGVYVNADDIENLLFENNTLDFNTFKLEINEDKIQEFFKKSTFSPIKRDEPNLWTKLKISNNVLSSNTRIDSYLAADIAEFIRQQLMLNGESFTYETVMSHHGKVSFLQEAIENNYRVYLYFIATEDPDININRVNVRVANHGHYVDSEIIKSRYYRSLQNLKEAVKKTNRAFIWDNSGTACLLISEITNGTEVKIIDTDKVPNWFIKYLTNNE